MSLQVFTGKLECNFCDFVLKRDLIEFDKGNLNKNRKIKWVTVVQVQAHKCEDLLVSLDGELNIFEFWMLVG